MNLQSKNKKRSILSNQRLEHEQNRNDSLEQCNNKVELFGAVELEDNL